MAGGSVGWYHLHGGLLVRVQPEKEKDHTNYFKQREFDRKNVLKGPRDLEREATQRLVTGGRCYYCSPGVGSQKEAVVGPETGAQPPPHCKVAVQGAGTTEKALPNPWPIVQLQRRGCLAKAGTLEEKVAKTEVSEGMQPLPEMPPESEGKVGG